MAKKKAKKTKKAKPSSDGRNGKGQFGKGNRCATGRNDTKAAQRTQKLKVVLAGAVTEKDLKDIATALVKKAKTGDVFAARELFDRLWGKAPQAITGEDGGPIKMEMVKFSELCTDKE